MLPPTNSTTVSMYPGDRMKLVIFGIFVIIASSCAHMLGASNQSDKNYQISQLDNPKTGYTTGNGHIRVKYEDYEQLSKAAEEKVKNELLSDEKAKEIRLQTPKGGWFVVKIFRPTVDTGNLKNFSYIIFKNGKEMSRFEGGSSFNAVDSVPSTPSYSGLDGNLWTNTDIIELKFPFTKEDNIGLYVADKLIGGRDEFNLSYKKIADKKSN
jgi:hypothetical protein